MNTTDWKYLYKINPDTGLPIETNLVYTPLISPNGKTFCMRFDQTSPYQTELDWMPDRPYYTEAMVQHFFNQEVKFFEKFKDKPWAPKLLEIDYDKQELFFEWSGETCNQILYTYRDLDQECPTWKEQLTAIVEDIVNDGCYKISLYPHCFYVDTGVLKTFDFYACVDRADCLIDLDLVRGMLGITSAPRFAEVTVGNQLDIGALFKRALETHIQWPDNQMNAIYQKLYS
jgi:hypothetical protein